MDIGREVNITTPDVMGNETEDHMDVDEDQIATEHPHTVGNPGPTTETVVPKNGRKVTWVLGRVK